MAAHRPAAKASSAGDCETLETAYSSLRSANEQLQHAEREFCRLMTVKMTRFSNPSEPSDLLALQKYELRGFGTQGTLGLDWSRWAAGAGILESVDNLDRELEKMNALKTAFGGIQSALRCCINKLSRPYLGNLSILDLPDEILLEIFEHVENFDLNSPLLYYYDPGRKDIKNTRLVCRRFCDVSSQLLVRFVRVHFNETSLARLDEISRHPTIAKGVRAVRVVLHLYNSSFADFDWFISYHTDEAEEQVDVFDRAKVWELSKIPEQTASEMIASGWAVVSALRQLESADPADGEYTREDEEHRARLDEIHREYLILLEKQESLIRSGKISWMVGSAIARMPGARKLDFGDADFDCMADRRLMSPGVDPWVALHRLILQPLTGYHAKKHGLELPDYQCVIDVIDSVRSAGALLNNIDIKLSTVGCPGSLAVTSDIRQEFSSGMRQLKAFAFRCDDSLDEQDADNLNKFLSVCLDTPNLKTLKLDMRGQEAETTRVDVGKIMGSQSRHELTDVFLGRVAIDLFNLVLFLNRLPESMYALYQEDVRLLSGTWKQALDVLRKKTSLVVIFREPHGAECDDMPLEGYKRAFSSKDSYQSEAEFYIRSRDSWRPNPIQALEDGLYTEN